MREIDWPTIIHIGLFELKLKPHEFWACTPKEFLILAGLKQSDDTLSIKQSFATLKELFPDKTQVNCD